MAHTRNSSHRSLSLDASDHFTDNKRTPVVREAFRLMFPTGTKRKMEDEGSSQNSPKCLRVAEQETVMKAEAEGPDLSLLIRGSHNFQIVRC